MGNITLADISEKLDNKEIDISYAINSAYLLGKDENSIENMVQELYKLCGNFVFVEYYSHEKCDCFKILNPFTNYKEDKHVLCTVNEGIKIALRNAIDIIKIDKQKFYGKVEK